MNKLADEQIADITSLALAGASIRAIMHKTGHSKPTISRYRSIALFGKNVRCGCGGEIGHKGWCGQRYKASVTRGAVIRYLTRPGQMQAVSHTPCVDCGGPKHECSGMRCMACYKLQCERNKEHNRLKTIPCRICRTLVGRNEHGKIPKHCANVWCARMFDFYFVGRRSRPSAALAAKTNELRFDFFLADYIRRYANEQANPNKRRTPRRSIRGVGIPANRREQSGPRS